MVDRVGGRLSGGSDGNPLNATLTSHVDENGMHTMVSEKSIIVYAIIG
jgi:hypothetical protein